MNIYHISYAPEVRQAYIHFWGCNMKCRACLCLKEIYDCHLEETRHRIFGQKGFPETPEQFLGIEEVLDLLAGLDLKVVFFMGMEPTEDAGLADLARELRDRFGTRHILLTNGYRLSPLRDIDEVVLSIKAVSEDVHLDYTGKGNAETLRNLRTIYSMEKKLLVESILIPDYIDREEIGRIAAFIASVDISIPYRIDPYLPVGDNPWRRPTAEEMKEAAAEAGKHLLNVSFLAVNEEIKFRVERIF